MSERSYWSWNLCDVSVMKGLTITSVEGKEHDSTLTFKTSCGREFAMYHSQACCEDVHLEDIAGEWEDILNRPLLVAEEVSNTDVGFTIPENEYPSEEQQWTFYRFGTDRGFVVLRWYGSSNGYYSTDVTFAENPKNG